MSLEDSYETQQVLLFEPDEESRRLLHNTADIDKRQQDNLSEGITTVCETVLTMCPVPQWQVIIEASLHTPMITADS